MKKFMTAAAIVAVMTLPAFAEGSDSSDKAGEAKGTVKATTDIKKDTGPSAMGQGAVIRRSTTGAASDNQINQTNKDENSSPANPGQKTDVSGGSGGSSGGGNQ